MEKLKIGVDVKSLFFYINYYNFPYSMGNKKKAVRPGLTDVGLRRTQTICK